MPVTVEFYGIPRARAGVAQTTAEGACLGEILLDLARQYPAFAKTCVQGDRLRDGFTANRQGLRFVSDPQTLLADQETVLIMSLDAGG